MSAIQVVRCQRSENAHILAELRSDAEGSYVIAREVVRHREGIEIRKAAYRPTDLSSDQGSFQINVGCACKHQYLLDLVPVFRGQRFEAAERFRPEDAPAPGVSDDTLPKS